MFLHLFRSWFAPKVKPGAIYIDYSKGSNPFVEIDYRVEIIDVKKDYVKFRYLLTGEEDSMSADVFRMFHRLITPARTPKNEKSKVIKYDFQAGQRK